MSYLYFLRVTAIRALPAPAQQLHVCRTVRRLRAGRHPGWVLQEALQEVECYAAGLPLNGQQVTEQQRDHGLRTLLYAPRSGYHQASSNRNEWAPQLQDLLETLAR